VGLKKSVPAVRQTTNPLPRWLAFAVLAAAWIPFITAAQSFSISGPLTYWVNGIALRFDGISLLLAAVVLGLSSMVALFSGPYMAGEAGEEKYYAMLLAVTGVMIGLGCAGDLFNLWVWFEAMAVSSYLLVVFYREQPASLEAGIKYVVQSATGSVLILFGIALVLGSTGSLDFIEIAAKATPSLPLLAAGGLFLIGFGVKAALVPMHTWLPDAHTQAPSGISAMLSGVVIEAGLVAMLRSLALFTGTTEGNTFTGINPETWGSLLIVFGALNMVVGNLMALRQNQVKRLLAYSSLSHIGYMVIGFGIAMFARQEAGAQGGLFHILNHSIMKGLAFLAAGALLYGMSRMADENQAASHGPLVLTDLNGAAQKYPLVAIAFSLAVLSLGGLPPFAGFMSKWQIFVSGFGASFETRHFLPLFAVIFAALNSVLSLAYYAPMVNAIYRKKPSAAVQAGSPVPLAMLAPLAVLSLLVIALGLWPNLAGWLTSPAGKAFIDVFGG
jgi:proton-translocating NADH-quinone oxidoreductase chain N